MVTGWMMSTGRPRKLVMFSASAIRNSKWKLLSGPWSVVRAAWGSAKTGMARANRSRACAGRVPKLMLPWRRPLRKSLSTVTMLGWCTLSVSTRNRRRLSALPSPVKLRLAMSA